MNLCVCMFVMPRFHFVHLGRHLLDNYTSKIIWILCKTYTYSYFFSDALFFLYFVYNSKNITQGKQLTVIHVFEIMNKITKKKTVCLNTDTEIVYAIEITRSRTSNRDRDREKE